MEKAGFSQLRADLNESLKRIGRLKTGVSTEVGETGLSHFSSRAVDSGRGEGLVSPEADERTVRLRPVSVDQRSSRLLKWRFTVLEVVGSATPQVPSAELWRVFCCSSLEPKC
ncbi:unnamed protein product [Schistocephalus solidus]|uniref:Uncharacterized protein n=1 Tax=Schistocephalus solidus TaxID=70667 RepID=A0A183SF29_SCHSO|nr:unnamed protein product [Schistocephalus solidus]